MSENKPGPIRISDADLPGLVLNKWLGTLNAPAHIQQPQLAELSSMSLVQLLHLYQADTTLSVEDLTNPDRLDGTLTKRLIERRAIAKVIAQKDKEDIYEVAEHLSGSVSPD